MLNNIATTVIVGAPDLAHITDEVDRDEFAAPVVETSEVSASETSTVIFTGEENDGITSPNLVAKLFSTDQRTELSVY